MSASQTFYEAVESETVDVRTEWKFIVYWNWTRMNFGRNCLFFCPVVSCQFFSPNTAPQLRLKSIKNQGMIISNGHHMMHDLFNWMETPTIVKSSNGRRWWWWWRDLMLHCNKSLSLHFKQKSIWRALARVKIKCRNDKNLSLWRYLRASTSQRIKHQHWFNQFTQEES